MQDEHRLDSTLAERPDDSVTVGVLSLGDHGYKLVFWIAVCCQASPEGSPSVDVDGVVDPFRIVDHGMPVDNKSFTVVILCPVPPDKDTNFQGLLINISV